VTFDTRLQAQALHNRSFLSLHSPEADMAPRSFDRQTHARRLLTAAPLAAALLLVASTASAQQTPLGSQVSAPSAPTPDPRVGLRAGLYDAAEATWNMKVVSRSRPAERFATSTNSDLAFTGKYAIQGSYNGYQIWDISNPAAPTLTTEYYCPASQSDVSVYKNLLFVSGEGLTGRLDCGAQGVRDTVSKDRLRGVRIFDITDIKNPKNVGNVQTCRGSHTHTVLVDPKDADNVYIYISGSSGVRSPNELAGCVSATPDQNANSALFRIEVIKVPLAHPELAAIVSSPRIFNDLTAPARHGEAPEDVAAAAKVLADAKARGAFTGTVFGAERVLPPNMVRPMLDSVITARGGTGAATAADSAALRAALPAILAARSGERPGGNRNAGPTQCHDITVYPAIGLAGGACGGYGLLLDIRNPAAPVRIGAVADSNFSYWHSATFSNDGSKVLFTDEWGGGGQPKCRSTDKHEWGADALFTLKDGVMTFQSYYKMPAAQTSNENCVAHNGSLIPIPGRDVFVQSWYQGGVSIFDWTDIRKPMEIAFMDRGPVDSTHMGNGGTWSVYWYNGVIVSSEISRGLDIFELSPSALVSQNEIDAAKSVHFDYLNAQGQPKLIWPASFAKARAYVDQLERSNGLPVARIATVRTALDAAEKTTGRARSTALNKLSTALHTEATASSDAPKAHMLAAAVGELAAAR
jgi:LVIVD repeat